MGECGLWGPGPGGSKVFPVKLPPPPAGRLLPFHGHPPVCLLTLGGLWATCGRRPHSVLGTALPSRKWIRGCRIQGRLTLGRAFPYFYLFLSCSGQHINQRMENSGNFSLWAHGAEFFLGRVRRVLALGPTAAPAGRFIHPQTVTLQAEGPLLGTFSASLLPHRQLPGCGKKVLIAQLCLILCNHTD